MDSENALALNRKQIDRCHFVRYKSYSPVESFKKLARSSTQPRPQRARLKLAEPSIQLSLRKIWQFVLSSLFRKKKLYVKKREPLICVVPTSTLSFQEGCGRCPSIC